MATMTEQERANCVEGICTRCGRFDRFRNTAGECTTGRDCCNTKGYDEYVQRRKAWLEAQKASGREFWASLGIKPGDKVERYAVSMLGFGGCRVVGTAKVGKVGAYVSAPHFQKGCLTRQGWRKVEATKKGVVSR